MVYLLRLLIQEAIVGKQVGNNRHPWDNGPIIVGTNATTAALALDVRLARGANVNKQLVGIVDLGVV
jgi:hypothetical protein